MKKSIFIILSCVLIITFFGCDTKKNNADSDETVSVNSATTTSHYEGNRCAYEILDFKTGNVISQGYASGDNDTLILMKLINNARSTNDKILSDPKYTIHLIDKGDSEYDIWVNVYIKNKSLYVQYIPEKMSYSEKLDITDEILKSKGVTVQEFLGVIKNK